ncbi:MAG TPA: sugar nucleotide-binding protein [Acidimicrobiales bacterium]|nr:sugar nucleotide-binding protein [Acidimicrobiales bacterium]
MSAHTRPTLVVVGASGYLGRRVALLARPHYRVLATYHSLPQPHSHPRPGDEVRALDVRDRAAVEACISDAAPSVVINCAYVQQGPDVEAITATAPGMLASAAQRAGARFVHLSSDVVFPGRSDRPYREDDDPAPVHDYGRAKRRAEQLVMAAHRAPLIIRTSLIYRGRADNGGADEGPQERMVRGALGGDDVWFFTDEIRNPIEVDVLASAILELAAGGHHGLLHVAGADAIDRFTFAQLLATAMDADASVLRGRPRDTMAAPRPGNLALDCTKARAILRDTVLTGAREALSRRGRRSDRGL